MEKLLYTQRPSCERRWQMPAGQDQDGSRLDWPGGHQFAAPGRRADRSMWFPFAVEGLRGLASSQGKLMDH